MDECYRPDPLLIDSLKLVYVGFGYDSVTNDYKVVRIVYAGENVPCRAEVYRLSTNSWTEIKMRLGIDIFCTENYHERAYSKGVFCWLVESPN